ncbi:hypothetical protein [Parapedobacter lycopersici]|uniref:hypothetical protein n=1 Tax=Parapedobacter lycopersici TaxID=1864939 RepID=UPI00333F6B5A
MKKLLNLLEFSVSVIVCFVFGVFLAGVFGVSESAMTFGVGMILLSMIPRLKPGMLAETIPSVNTPDISKLVGYLGKFQKKLFSTMRNALDIAKDLYVMPGIKNAENLTKLKVKDGVKGYEETFEPDAGDLEYIPRKITVELLKRDVRVNVLKYRNTWMAEVMRRGVDPKDFPFAQFVLEAIAKSIAAEINDNAYYAVAGARTSFATSVDGLAKIIADEITATNITPIATGAITNTNAVAQIEKVLAEVASPYIKNGLNVDVSYNVFRKYQEDYRERYGKYIQRNENGNFTVDSYGPNVELVPATWMGTSQRIIATPFENLILGTDSLSDSERLMPESEFEIIKLRALFAMGFQIRDLEAIWVNDVDVLAP